MDVEQIEFRGTLDLIEMVKEACEKLPPDIITPGENLIAEHGNLVDIYPNISRKEISTVKVPDIASEVYAYPDSISFKYKGLRYTIYFNHKE